MVDMIISDRYGPWASVTTEDTQCWFLASNEVVCMDRKDSETVIIRPDVFQVLGEILGERQQRNRERVAEIERAYRDSADTGRGDSNLLPEPRSESPPGGEAPGVRDHDYG